MITLKHKKWWHRFIPGKTKKLRLAEKYINSIGVEAIMQEAWQEMILYGHVDTDAIVAKHLNKQR